MSLYTISLPWYLKGLAGIVLAAAISCTPQTPPPYLSTPFSTAPLEEWIAPVPTATSTKEAAIIPSPTTTVVTSAASPAASPTPAPILIEPLQKSDSRHPGLRFDSWSPTGRWLAYWLGSDEETAPSVLSFLSTSSDDQCFIELDGQAYWNGRVVWEEDDQTLVVPGQSRQVLQGTPCGDFDPAEHLFGEDPDHTLSPGGDYRYEMHILGGEGDLYQAETRLIETGEGGLLTSFLWQGTPHHVGRRGWLTDELLLIGQTVDQGLVYLQLPEGRPGRVFPDWMGLAPDEEKDVSAVDFYVGSHTGTFSLLVQRGMGQPILLYSSQTGQVEVLPFSYAYPLRRGPGGGLFSANGKWLLLGNPTDYAMETAGYWLYELGAEAEAGRLPGFGQFQGLSSAPEKMVFFSDSTANLLSFPAVEWIGKWRAPGYKLNQAFWSPGGEGLAVIGTDNESGEIGLFFIRP
jgi:hypothetical protein